MPDVRFIEEERKNLLGIVITHAPRGPYRRAGRSVAAPAGRRSTPRRSPRSCWTVQAACRSRARRTVPIKIVPVGGRVSLGPFEVEFITVAHSIPEADALAIRTPLGTVAAHRRLEDRPHAGASAPPTDEARLRALGDEGVLALVCDSTNAMREGRSPSEAEVAPTLAKVIAEAQAARRRHHLRLQRRRACGRSPRPPRRPAARWWSSAAPCTASSRWRANSAICDGLPPVPLGRHLRLPAARQGGGAAHRQPGRAARGAGPHRRRRAPRHRAVARRHRRLLLPHHPRQRDRHRPHHQRADPPGRRGHHRPHSLVHVSGHPRRGEMADLCAGCARTSCCRCMARRCTCTSMPCWPGARRSRGGAVRQRRHGAAGAGAGRGGRRGAGGRLYKDGKVLIEDASRTIAERRKLSFVGIVSVALALTDKGELAGESASSRSACPSARPTAAPSTRSSTTRCSKPSTPCRGRAGAIRAPSRNRSCAACAVRSQRPGERSRLSR